MANAAVVYDREYDNDTLSFEPSGGLIHASLVMQDRETDTYWSIMTHEGVQGEKKGTKLKELPLGVKTQWKNWIKIHPDTQVLSVEGKEDAKVAYTRYFNSDGGFRGIQATDRRLADKEAIFAFQVDGKNYAIQHSILSNGKLTRIDNLFVFLFRPANAGLFQSTSAYKLNKGEFELRNGKWVVSNSDCVFNPQTFEFEGSDPSCPEKLEGLDTFWYTWSLTHPGTIVLQ